MSIKTSLNFEPPIDPDKNDIDELVIRASDSNGILSSNNNASMKVIHVDSLQGYLTNVIYDSNGNIVACGAHDNNFIIIRYNSDGEIDHTFNGNGYVQLNLGNPDIPYDLIETAQGDLLIVGMNNSNGGFTLLKLKNDGSIDTDFGNSGVFSSNFIAGEARSVLIQNDQKIIIAGMVYPSAQQADFCLMRLLADGTIDTSFGMNGYAINDVKNSIDVLMQAEILPDGKIIAAGSSNNDQLIIAKYNNDGTLDNTFGDNGIVTTDISINGIDAYRGIAIQNDGKILAVGHTWTGSKSDILVARYEANGNLDQTFGDSSNAGISILNISEYNDYGTGITINGDKIFISSHSNNDDSSISWANIVCLTVDGIIDTSFHGTGISKFENGAAYNIASNSNGDIAAVGWDGGTSNQLLSIFLENNESNNNFIGGVDNDIILGNSSANLISGLDGNDTLSGNGGNDTIDGGSGTDISAYQGISLNYAITLSGENISVSDKSNLDGTDQLNSIEIIKFSDFSLDTSMFIKTASLSDVQIASLVELYIASFNRAPDSVGLDYWGSRFYDSIHNIENGMTLDQIAKSFFEQPETMAAYPSFMAVEEFVTTVYNNVLSRGPDKDGLNYWVGELNNGNVSKDSFLLAIINGAKAITGGAEDRQTLANKTDVGMYYALEKGLNNYTDWAKDVMSSVNSNASTVTDANAKTDVYAAIAADPSTSDLVVKLVGVYEGLAA